MLAGRFSGSHLPNRSPTIASNEPTARVDVRDHDDVNAEYRQSLLNISARLDQMLAEASAILAGPGDSELYMMAEDLREWVVMMQAKVEETLDRGEP
jgi:hypothetical protein